MIILTYSDQSIPKQDTVILSELYPDSIGKYLLIQNKTSTILYVSNDISSPTNGIIIGNGDSIIIASSTDPIYISNNSFTDGIISTSIYEPEGSSGNVEELKEQVQRNTDDITGLITAYTKIISDIDNLSFG